MNIGATTEPVIRQKPIPHLKGSFLLGQSAAFMNDCGKLFDDMYTQCGELSTSSILLKKCYTLLGPDANELVLLNKGGVFSNKIGWEKMLDALFRNGLMLKDSDDHRYSRRIMNVAFTREALQSYIALSNEQAEQTLRSWTSSAPVQFYGSIKSLTLDLALQLFVGERPGAKADEINHWFTKLVDASLVPFKANIPYTRYWHGLQSRRQLLAYFQLIAPQKRANPGADMLSRLTQAKDEQGDSFTDLEIAENMVFLMMAAHDTTTSAMTSLVYFLAKHPQWQNAIREEINGVGTEHLSYDQLPDLALTSAAFKEALRMMPPLAVIPRGATQDIPFKDYVIPNEALVQICPIFTHYQPDIWTQPHTFDPERFSSQRQEDKQHRYAYIPFGGGAHKCLGLHFAENQVKIVLFHLLKQYQIDVADDYAPIWLKVPIVHPKDGLPVRLKKLN